MKKLSFMLLALAIMLAGCADPAIDGSSEETMAASLEEVKSDLPKDERARFDDALDSYLLFTIGYEDYLQTPQSAATRARIREALHGKTGMDIIDGVPEAERQSALRELARLKEKKQRAIEVKKALEDFRVESSLFYKLKDKYGKPVPHVKLRVRNNTPHPVSKAYFRSTLTAPGRAAPLLRKEFSYQAPGGLTPGRDAYWQLTFDRYSEWGTVDAPVDAVLYVEVFRLDGTDNKPLLFLQELTADEAEKLEELSERFSGETDG